MQLLEISVLRDSKRVLSGVSLAITPGEVVVVVGAHRAGKTTLLEAALDLIPRSAGDVRIDGQAPSWRARAHSVTYLAADAEPALETRVSTQLAAYQQAEQASPQRAAECERQLGLSPLRALRMTALSRRERQRVLLFGALLSNKPFWLLDDPLGCFDPEERSQLSPLLLAAARRGAGILVTTTELLGSEALAEQLVVLEAGTVTARGTRDALRAQSGLPPGASLDQVCGFLARGSIPPGEPQVRAC